MRFSILVLCAATGLWSFPARAQEAQEEDKSQPERPYTGRVKMHKAPFEIKVPDESAPRPAAAREAAPVLEPAPESALLSPVVQPYVPVLPRAPAREDRPEKKANWILPPVVEETGFEEPPEPSGWGWLADGAQQFRRRQEAEEQKTQEAFDETARGEQRPGPSTLSTRTLPLDTPLPPAAGTEPVRDVGAAVPEEAADASRDAAEARGEQAAAADTAATLEERAREPAERPYSAGRGWGETPDSKARGANTGLTRSEALFAEMRSGLPVAPLTTLQDQLDRYREMLARPQAAESGKTDSGALAPSPPRPVNPWAAPAERGVKAVPSPFASTPATAGSLSSPTPLGSSFQPLESRFGAAFDSGALKALQPYQPLGPVAPLSDPWSSAGGAAAGSAGGADSTRQPTMPSGYGFR